MANITAKDVQALRAKTGIGMMECKKALVEANGDAEEAIKILRKRGELKADAKAATRIAADGIVDIMKDGNVTAIVEVNSETDFVAKNASFQEFVKNILKTIIANRPANVEELLASTYVDGDVTVEAKLKEMIFVIGEKITVRRFAIVEGCTSTYIHGAGSIGVVVSFDADAAIVANYVDSMVFVAAEERVAIPQIEYALSDILTTKADIMGCIYNRAGTGTLKVATEKAGGYFSNRYGGYYGSSYYYGSRHHKKKR